MAGTFVKECRDNILALLMGPGGSFLKARLFKNPIVLDDNTQLVMLSTPDYDGYADKVSSGWTIPARNTGGDEFIRSPTFVFQMSGVFVSNMIYGYCVLRDNGVDPPFLVMIERYEEPKRMAVITDEIPLQVEIDLRNLIA
jgi:hypothetical protein